MEEAQAARAEHCKKKKHVNKEVRRLVDADRKKRARECQGLVNMKISKKRLIMRAYWLVDFNTADCILLLDHLYRPMVWGNLPGPARVELIEDLFLETDLDLLESWVDVEARLHAPRMRELFSVKAELKTAQWVARVNATRGVAPSSAQVFKTYCDHMGSAPEEWRPHFSSRSRYARRMWTMRWRNRWEASLGILKTGELDTAADLREKAAKAYSPWAWF